MLVFSYIYQKYTLSFTLISCIFFSLFLFGYDIKEKKNFLKIPSRFPETIAVTLSSTTTNIATNLTGSIPDVYMKKIFSSFLIKLFIPPFFSRYPAPYLVSFLVTFPSISFFQI